MKWERELGWLNLRADRHAARILRCFTHLLHVFLLIALLGILAFAWLLGQPHDMDAYTGAFAMPFQFVWLAVFLGIWITYFLAMLGPRVRAEFEEEELRRYRMEHPEEDKRERKSPERLRVSIWEAGRPRRF